MTGPLFLACTVLPLTVMFIALHEATVGRKYAMRVAALSALLALAGVIASASAAMGEKFP
jgi:hypothetical protein